MAALFPSDHAVVDVVSAAASFPVVVAAFGEIFVAVDPDGFVAVAVVAVVSPLLVVSGPGFAVAVSGVSVPGIAVPVPAVVVSGVVVPGVVVPVVVAPGVSAPGAAVPVVPDVAAVARLVVVPVVVRLTAVALDPAAGPSPTLPIAPAPDSHLSRPTVQTAVSVPHSPVDPRVVPAVAPSR